MARMSLIFFQAPVVEEVVTVQEVEETVVEVSAEEEVSSTTRLHVPYFIEPLLKVNR